MQKYSEIRNIVFLCGLFTCPGLQTTSAESEPYSPYADVSYPERVFWVDTHLHTTNSLDARMLGVTLDVEDAYRFARGEQIVASSGQPARLSRPLDFLVVTDHSDALGVVDQLMRGNPELLKDPEARELHEKLTGSESSALEATREIFRVLLEQDYRGPIRVRA